MVFCSEQGLQGRLWKSNVIPGNLVDSPKYKVIYEAWMSLNETRQKTDTRPFLLMDDIVFRELKGQSNGIHLLPRF